MTSVNSVNKLFPEKVGEEVKEAVQPQPGMNAEEGRSEESKRPTRNSSEPCRLGSSESCDLKDRSIHQNNGGGIGGHFGNYSFQRNSSGQKITSGKKISSGELSVGASSKSLTLKFSNQDLMPENATGPEEQKFSKYSPVLKLPANHDLPRRSLFSKESAVSCKYH